MIRNNSSLFSASMYGFSAPFRNLEAARGQNVTNLSNCDSSARSAGIVIKTAGIERTQFSASKLCPKFYFRTKKYFSEIENKIKKIFFWKIFKIKKNQKFPDYFFQNQFSP